ncbi:nuclear transport factor 2 family protein [Panacagrimonas sp.]|uniref:nuclear transport factor 2 family protein n=1 Tax=Panacagrimonas sp. TaxID=2480088 RepID=UPI003B51F39E
MNTTATPSDDPVALWHRALKSKDTRLLDDLLADEVVFLSPVVHTPQVGRKITKAYLSAAFFVFVNDTFRYVRELRGERDAVLEFTLELDGIQINGVDMMRWNDAGKLTEFKVMLRPLKAVNLIHQKMGQALQAAKPA